MIHEVDAHQLTGTLDLNSKIGVIRAGAQVARRMVMANSQNSSISKEESAKTVKAREVSLTQRLIPLFKAAAVVAIILTIGGALQAPWDNSWNTPQDYARIQQDLDSVAAVSPIQAENMSDWSTDSAKILMERPKN